MRADLDTYLETCSQRRLHHGRRREVHTPYQGLTPASRSPRMPERGAQDEGSLEQSSGEGRVSGHYHLSTLNLT